MLSEASLMEEAARHSRRLGSLAIAASNASWKHDELMREVRLAFGAAKRDALARLAALLASYAAPTPAIPAPAEASRFRQGLKAISRTLANGTAVGLVVFGLFYATRPTVAVVHCDFMSAADFERFAQAADATQWTLDVQAGRQPSNGATQR